MQVLAPRCSVSSLSLLIADDDRRCRETMAGYFRGLGWTVIDGDIANDVISIINAIRPRYAVIEPNLPGSLWFRMLQSIRRVSFEMTWVALTAYYSTALHNCAEQAGARGILKKPATPHQIHLALTAVASEQVGCSAAAGAAHVRPREMSLHLAQWEYVNAVLARCAGNVREASRRLRISRQTLYRHLRTYPPLQ